MGTHTTCPTNDPTLTRLLARAIVAQARRQADQQSAAQVLEHQDGNAPIAPALRGEETDAKKPYARHLAGST